MMPHNYEKKDYRQKLWDHLAQMALSWVLRDGEVTSVLIGASRASQITENTKIVEASAFTSDELSAIEAVLNA